MKLKYLFIGILFLFSVLTGCEKESEGLFDITYYVTFNFDLAQGIDELGNAKIIVEKGAGYDVNQNFTASEGETDVTSNAVVSGSVDSNTPGYYVVDYSAENSDGYSASTSIGVVVSDPAITTDISGSYISDVDRTPEFYGPFTGLSANIIKVAPGIFYMDRILGNYYYEGAGLSTFGHLYVHGFVRLNTDNTLTLLGNWTPYWQTTIDDPDFTGDATYNPATGVIEYTAKFFGRYFHVVLTPN